MTIKYSVDSSFSLYDSEGASYIQSSKFSAKIKHTGLKNFLGYLLQNKLGNITQSELDVLANKYEVDTKALQDFLVAQTGLLKVNISDNHFDNFVIYGENDVSKFISDAIQDKFKINIQHINGNAEINSSNTIVLCYLPAYHPEKIQELYSNISDRDNYIITSYLMNDHLIIDNIFSKNAGLPCHFCHLERLKINSKLIPAGQNKSWLSYYREVLRKNNSALFETTLPAITKQYIAYCHYQFIRRLIDPFCSEWHYDQYNHFWHIHLEKMTITKEAASFWPYCTCQNL